MLQLSSMDIVVSRFGLLFHHQSHCVFPCFFPAASNFPDFKTIVEKNTKLRCRKKYGIRCN